jgi:hypothetical protein
MLLAFTKNIKLGWNCRPETNTSAYSYFYFLSLCCGIVFSKLRTIIAELLSRKGLCIMRCIKNPTISRCEWLLDLNPAN